MAEKPSPKPTAAEMDLRVDRVVSFIIAGSRRSELVQYAANEWKIKTRQADELIARARLKIEAQTDENIARRKRTHRQRLDEMFRRAMNVGDLTNAAKVEKLTLQFDGLLEEKHRVTHVDPITRAIEELEEELATFDGLSPAPMEA